MYRKYICITNRHLVSGSVGAECTIEEYISQLEKCVALHPYAVILREKDMDRQDYRELARHIQVMCRKASVKMFVHSDISVAEYAGCGLGFLKEVCTVVHGINPNVKVFAIGGIKPDNIEKVIDAGADGGCMMSWFMEHI